MENNKYGILAACEELHRHVTGASDSLTEGQADSLYTFLYDRLEFWNSGKAFTNRYDSAVYKLVNEAMTEYEHVLAKRHKY